MSLKTARRRCTICGVCDWIDRGGREECSHCRLVIDDPSRLDGVVNDLRARLASGEIDLERDPPLGWTLDPAGLRNAAWALGYVLDPGDFAPADRPGRATTRPATSVGHAVTLAIMTRAADAGEAIALLRSLRSNFARVCVLVDGDAVAMVEALPWAEIGSHPLDGDFAAQRNRLQDMAGPGWVLQIDTDERPDERLLASLGWLTREADCDGLRSLGLPRRNLVDGKQSALYPDIQYRLNRADIRFEGRVHERPVVPFVESSLALAGALEHRLSGARVAERTRIYEAMSTGAGRPEDEVRLLEPFDAIAVR